MFFFNIFSYKPMPFTNSTILTLLFGLATTLIYLVLSTSRVYCPDNADFVGDHLPHSCKPPPDDIGEDFLFRVGVAHVYGIRALVIGLMIGGSTLAATILAYVAFAHRKRVRRDITETWRMPGSPVPEGNEDKRYAAFLMTPTSAGVDKKGFSRTPRSRVRPSFVSLSASFPPSMRRLNPRSPHLPRSPCSPARSNGTRFKGPSSLPNSAAHSSVYSRDVSGSPRSPKSPRVVKQHARRPVSFIIARTEQRENKRRQYAEKLAVAHDENARTNMSIIPLPLFSNRTSSSKYEIPSYYFEPPFDNPGRNAAGSVDSFSIPSYYLKEHDEEGRSIIELGLVDQQTAATPTVTISPPPSVTDTVTASTTTSAIKAISTGTALADQASPKKDANA